MSNEEIPTVGLGFYWTDLKLGQKFKTVGRTVTEADIANFIGVTGMTEMLFNNYEFLKNESAIKGRPAPGAGRPPMGDSSLMNSMLLNSTSVMPVTPVKMVMSASVTVRPTVLNL